jgi:hypothetical protein
MLPSRLRTTAAVQKCRSRFLLRTANSAPTAEVPRKATAEGEIEGDGEGEVDGDGEGDVDGDGEGDVDGDGDVVEDGVAGGERVADAEADGAGTPADASAVDSPGGYAATKTATATAAETAIDSAVHTYLVTGRMTPRSRHRHLRFRPKGRRNFTPTGHYCPPPAARSLSFAAATWSGSISKPTNEQPRLMAATPVVPEPLNGSRTTTSGPALP